MSPVAQARPLTRRELEAQIIARAWRDPAYMEALKRDPKAVLQAETHAVDPTITLPADLKVHVHEETPTDFHLVLPRNPADIKLSEVVGDNLEAIAPQTVAVVTVSGPVSVVGPISMVSPITMVSPVAVIVAAVVTTNAVNAAASVNNAVVVANLIA